MSNPTENYKIIHPKSKSGDGNIQIEDKQLSIITLGKRLSQTQFGDPQKFLAAIMNVDGVDALQPLGVYTIQVVIANTFNYDEVLNNIKSVLDHGLSAIVIPLRKINSDLATT